MVTHNPKVVWITGSSGFIGNHLACQLEQEGYKLVRISNRYGHNNLSNKSIMQPIYMDYSSKEDIMEKIANNGIPDCFIHLGWGDMSQPMSLVHLESNVDNAKTLIKTLYCQGLARFVFVGSMNEYGARSGNLTGDLERIGRLTNYAKGKIEVSNYGFGMSKLYDKTFIHIRPFYVYGPGQRQGSLINELFEAHVANRDAILGPCQHYRDYIYVQDVVAGIIRLMKVNKSLTVNLGSGSFIKVMEYVKMFWKQLGGESNRLKFGSIPMSIDEPEQPKSWADLSLLVETIGWKPVCTMDYGIQHTITELSRATSINPS